jgi:hypothetical protein
VAHDLEKGEWVAQLPFFPDVHPAGLSASTVKKQVAECIGHGSGGDPPEFTIVSSKAWSMDGAVADTFQKVKSHPVSPPFLHAFGLLTRLMVRRTACGPLNQSLKTPLETLVGKPYLHPHRNPGPYAQMTIPPSPDLAKSKPNNRAVFSWPAMQPTSSPPRVDSASTRAFRMLTTLLGSWPAWSAPRPRMPCSRRIHWRGSLLRMQTRI